MDKVILHSLEKFLEDRKPAIMVGAAVDVAAPGPNDLWRDEFQGTVIKVRPDGFEVRDQDNDVFCVDASQVSLIDLD
jgi:hypothetical protein